MSRHLADLGYTQADLDIFLLVERYAGVFGGWVLAKEVENDAEKDGDAAPNVEAARPTERRCREIARTQQAYYITDPAAGIDECRCGKAEQRERIRNIYSA